MTAQFAVIEAPVRVMRRILRLLDFEAEEIAILEMTGHSDLDENDDD